MLYLSDVLIQGKNLETFDELVAELKKRAAAGELFFQMDVKPPFPPNGLSVTPEGQAWVRRHTVAGAAPEYDVFDSEGNRLRTVVLPEDTRVVGFGEGSVYVSRTDEYDLQWLEKYGRWDGERR